jgi:hypothetical protein
MYTLSYASATHCAQQAQQAALALQQQVTSAFTVTVKQKTVQNVLYHIVSVTRKFVNYDAAVRCFSNTVQQYCATVAQYIDDEEYPASCYVLDTDGGACY